MSAPTLAGSVRNNSTATHQSGGGRKTGSAAALTLHLFIAELEKAFAFAILALGFFLIRVLRHGRSLQSACLLPATPTG
jgi:hypothetical protein